MPPPPPPPPPQASQQPPCSLSWLWTTTIQPARKTTARDRPKASRPRSRVTRPRSNKRRTRREPAHQREQVARVFQTQGIPEHVLLLLDIGSIEAFVAFLGELGRSAKHDPATACGAFQDDALWHRMLDVHFKIPSGTLRTAHGSSSILQRTRCKTHQSKQLALDKLLESSGGGCASLVQFLAWSQEREWFEQHVDVVMGDTFVVPHLPDVEFREKTDKIRLWKHGLAIMDPAMSASLVSNTQVRCLIHVIDAQIAIQSPWESLSHSFMDALDVIQRERRLNVAIVTPSRAPESSAAASGLRAIQQFAIQSDWNGRIGIVCYDEQRFQAFKTEKQRVLNAFGTLAWR